MSVQNEIEKLRGIAERAVDAVASKQEAVTSAATSLATIVGPLATAHRLAELAQEFFDLAKQRGMI